MKTYNEMANDVLRRIEENRVLKTKKRKMYTKYAVSFATLAILVMVGFGVWNNTKSPIDDDQLGEKFPNEDHTSIENSDPKDDVITIVEKDEIWVDEDHADEQFWVEGWSGKNIAGTLYDAFQKYGDDTVFAITAIYNTVDVEYLYNGKTLAEYQNEMWDEQDLIIKLESLVKDGEYLKYGDTLVTLGTPDGEKWSAELYDERVSWYTQEVLDRYIQNGEFLKDRLENDLQALYKEEAQLAYEEAIGAYIQSVNLKAKEKLEEQNIVCEYSPDVPYLIIHATESEMEKLELENQLDWLFELAVKRGDGAQDLVDEAE